MTMKKTATTGLAIVIALSMLAACSGGGDNKKNEQSPAPSKAAAAQTEGGEATEGTAGNLASAEPIDLSIHLLLGGNVFNDDWAVFKKAAELTNVSLKGTITKNVTDAKEAFNLMMASRDVADIVASNKANFDKFGLEGAFVPLNDLIDEHAPNIKSFFEAHPDVRKNATASDGNIYFIPFTPDGEAATGWFVRQDWLDKLGLKKPATVDEYYQTLKAFKERDPNGNGKADEIPYFHGATTFGIYFLLSLWDSGTDFSIKDDKVIFGPLEQEYKTGMANLAQWYKEGLIDQEIFTRGGSARETLLGDNVGGSTHDWFGSTAGYNKTLQATIPDFKFHPIAPPASASGAVAEYDFRATVGNNGWAISSDNKYPVETIKYFDYFFTEEGRTLMNFGVEGETYTIVDGKPTFTDAILAESNVVKTLKDNYGVQIEIGFHQNFEYEKQWMDPIALQGALEYIDNGYIKKTRLPNLAYTPEEQARIQELLGPITTYRQETGQKWILGAESVEAGYDTFIAQLKAMNVDELLEIYNAAYSRYKSQ